jgi:superfamily II DNA or RNA helicase
MEKHMLRVHIKPTSIWLYPYTLHLCYKLEKILGIFDIYLKKYTAFLYEFDREENKNIGVLKIPKGLGLDTVKSCLDSQDEGEKPIEYTIVDDSMVYASPRKIQFQMKKPPRNEEQLKSIEYLNKTQERQKMLCLDVGRGKTYCATHFICDQGYASLIISYNLSDQWFNKISEYTDCTGGKDIILIVGSSFLEDCIKNPKKYNAKIYICSLSTLVSFAQNNGKAALQKIVDNLGIGIKVFDEAHTRFLQFNMVDLNMQVAQTVYLTATPGRSNVQEKRMFSKIYSNVKTYGNTISGYNDHYTIRFITYDSKPSTGKRSLFKTIRGLKSTNYSRYLFDTYPYFAHDLVTQYMIPIFDEDKDAKVLIIIDWLRDMVLIRDQFKNNDYVIKNKLSVGVHSQVVKNPKEREEQLKSNIIIGSIGSMQNGKDIPNLRAIFPFTQFSSEIVAQQLLGRLRAIKGKEVIYYDIADRGVPDIMKQRYIRKKVFEPRSISTIQEDIIYDMNNVSRPFEKDKPEYFRSVKIS